MMSGDIFGKAPEFKGLESPIPNGQKKVIDVLTANTKDKHEKKVREWAEDVWNYWYSKHGMAIEKLVDANF